MTPNIPLFESVVLHNLQTQQHMNDVKIILACNNFVVIAVYEQSLHMVNIVQVSASAVLCCVHTESNVSMHNLYSLHRLLWCPNAEQYQTPDTESCLQQSQLHNVYNAVATFELCSWQLLWTHAYDAWQPTEHAMLDVASTRM